MKKIVFVLIFSLLFIGCAGGGNIQGVNATMKMNGAERTFSVGNGWKYEFIVFITNGRKGTIARIIARRGDTLQEVAALGEGEIYTETLKSPMCYGSNGNGYNNYSWLNKPLLTTYIVNVYKVVEMADVVGSGEISVKTEFLYSQDLQFNMFDCRQPVNHQETLVLR